MDTLNANGRLIFFNLYGISVANGLFKINFNFNYLLFFMFKSLTFTRFDIDNRLLALT
jgi:hypothetical protein